MAAPTAADIDDILGAAATNAEEGVQSATVDGRSATGINPLDQIKVAKELAAATATRNTGGAWGSALRSRSVPPGSI